MNTTAAAAQRKNRKRTDAPNEDRFRLLDQRVGPVRAAGRGQLFAVADGVGGAALGMRAAQQAVDVWLELFTADGPPPDAAALARLAWKANDTIWEWGQDPTGKSLGAAAMSAAWIAPPADPDADETELVVLHAGDTQVILVRDGRWSVLTRPQSEGRSLLNYVGRGPAFRITTTTHRIGLGDALVLTTDGVSEVVSPGEQSAAAYGRDPQVAADELVALAWARGSVDDLTALVARVDDWIL